MKSTFVSSLLLCGLLPALSATAASRSSSNYTIAADTVDAGGTAAVSAVYSNSGSMGGLGGIASVSSPAEFNKTGYLGQINDPTGLAVSAPSQTVNETATLQLSASLSLDDASLLAVPPDSVTWTVQGGPIGSITSAGLLTAGAVYQNTAATVQGTLVGLSGTFALTVVNSLPDNFGVYAGDGIDDAWQVTYFGLGKNGQGDPFGGASMDADGTGQSNLFKYLYGLNPLQPSARFEVSIFPAPPGQQSIVISPIVPGRTYTLQSTASLSTPNWQTVPGTVQSDSGTIRTITDPAGTGMARFYRVQVSLP